MPITNTGSANRDLSQFTGAHSGFGVPGFRQGGGTGFDFGGLLKERFKMQQQMQKEQLRTMTERRMQARKDELSAKHQRKLDQKAQKEQLLQAKKSRRGHYVYGEPPGAGLPQAIAGQAPLSWQNALTRQASMPFAPQAGEFAAPGSGASFGQLESAAGPSLYESNVAQTRSGKGYREGGYVPETKKYKLHKGEVVLNPAQTQQMFPGIGKGTSKKGYEDGSLSPYDVMGPGAGGGSIFGKTISDIGGGIKSVVGAAFRVDPEDVTDEDINYFLKKQGQEPVSGLGQGLPGPGGAPGGIDSALGGRGIKLPWDESVGLAGERSFSNRDRPGEPLGPGARFEETLTKKRREAELEGDRAKMARISAQNMETYMMKRPQADNKALEKIAKARTKEADKAEKKAESLSKEVTGSRLEKEGLQAAMSQQYFQSRTKRLDVAFDTIDKTWQAAIKSPNDDLGEEEWAKYSLSLMAPYVDDLAEMNGVDRDTMIENLYQLLVDTYDDGPSTIKWLKLSLQGR